MDLSILRSLEKLAMNGKSTPITYKPKFVKENASGHDNSEIPELVYANDGRQFFPCKFCCFAFADKAEQVQHMKVCNFRDEQSLPSPIRFPAKARKSFAGPPKVQQVQTPSPNGFKKPQVPVTITRRSSLRPKQDSLVSITKPKFAFPKIKLNPASITNNPKFVEDNSSSNVCTLCGEVFSNKLVLYQHKKDRHTKIYVPTETLSEYDVLFRRSDMTKCVICDKPVIKPQWARHLATHAEDKPFGCGFCSRKFRRKDQCKVHEKTHSAP
ncbi:hypothetical protein FQR65_LT12306 [Abscondita terminalis]|nr:hypothetical protein FQR65_LT12306 [Abscondita terminalis]